MVAKAKFRIEGEDATAAAFRAALGNAQGAASRMQGMFRTAFAGISVAAIARVGLQAIQLGDDLNKAAIKAGIGARDISELAHAAKMADVDLGGLSTSIRFMHKNLSEAESGAKGPTEALGALGLKIQELKGMKPDQQFELLADRISQLEDPADRSRAATELFGKAGADLLPMFEDGAAGIRAAREEARLLGVDFGPEMIKKLSDADTAIKQLKASFTGLTTEITAATAGSLSYFMAELTSLVSGKEIPRMRVLQEEIRVLKESLQPENVEDGFQSWGAFGGAPDVEAGFYNVEERLLKLQQLQRKLRDMQASTTELSEVKVLGRRVGGFSAVTEAEEARKAAAKAAEDQLKRSRDEMEDFLSELNRDVEKRGDASVGMIDDQIENQQRLSEFNDQMLDDWIDRENAMQKASEETYGEISEYALQAARNMQTAFADFLFDPFEDGLKGMLKGFIDTIRRMVAEAAAAQIFGSKASGGLGLGDWITAGVGAAFGGGRAAGGPIEQGKWYIAGEKGPEPIWGGGSGAFAAGYGKGGGAPVVNITQNIDARGATPDVIRSLPGILKAHGEAITTDIIMGIRRGKYAV